MGVQRSECGTLWQKDGGEIALLDTVTCKPRDSGEEVVVQGWAERPAEQNRKPRNGTTR